MNLERATDNRVLGHTFSSEYCLARVFLSLIHYKKWTNKLEWVFKLTVVGVILFSGSIYLLALKNELGDVLG